MPAEADWNGLPVHLMHLILKKLEAHGYMRFLAVMRLVSKSWRAAVREYPAILGWSVDKLEDVSRLCALMPSMSVIQASSEGREINLQPLSACSQLTLVCLIGEPKMPSDVVCVDLAKLPASAKFVEMVDVKFSNSIFGSSSNPNVTQLNIVNSQNEVEDISLLLGDLPGLQVSCCCIPTTIIFCSARL